MYFTVIIPLQFTYIHCPLLCLGPTGDFCIGDGEMYNYTRDASRCLAILSISTSSSDENN